MTRAGDPQDVLIVGGGMAGATLACALGLQGLRVTVVEAREPERSGTASDYDLRVSALSPGSEQILRALDAWPAGEGTRLCPYRRMHVWDAGSRGEIHFDCVEVNEPRLGYIVEHRVVQRALLARLKQIEEIRWRCPDALRGFEIDQESVQAELESGERIAARLLVGADGSRSRVRELASIVFQARDYHQSAVVATVGTERSHAFTAWQRFLPDGVLAFLPLADGRCSIVWSTSEARAQFLAATDDESFSNALAEAFDYRLGRIISASARAVFPLRGGQADPYVKPRVALIGDAAHSIHPLAGQGANLGLMDAATLAEVLVGARRDLGSVRLLRRYERARKGENVAMMFAMEGFQSLFTRRALVWRALRGLGLNFTDAVAPVKHQFMRHAMGLAGERPRLARGCL
jgi:2-polyprenylphenol 6-hydroxylase